MNWPCTHHINTLEKAVIVNCERSQLSNPQHDLPLVKLLIHFKGLCLYQKLKNANYLQGMLNLLGPVSYISKTKKNAEVCT